MTKLTRIEEVKKILTSTFDRGGRVQYEYALQKLSLKRMDDRRISAIEEATSQICQLFPQPLDGKELREKIEIVLGESHYGAEAYERYRLRLSQPDDWQKFQLDIDQILALLPPKIEEAKRHYEHLCEDCGHIYFTNAVEIAKREERERVAEEMRQIRVDRGDYVTDWQLVWMKFEQALKGN